MGLVQDTEGSKVCLDMGVMPTGIMDVSTPAAGDNESTVTPLHWRL